MTNSGMFDDPEKIEYLENQNKLLKDKLKKAVSKIKRIETLEKHHLKNNGDLRVHIKKLEKQISDFICAKTGLFHKAFTVIYVKEIPRNESGKVVFYGRV